MRLTWLAVLLAGCLLALLVWFHPGLVGLAKLQDLLGTSAAPHGSSRSQAAGQLRKCVVQDEVLYTNGECPAGSRQQAVAGGSVSVLPAAPVAAPASAPRGPNKHVRDLLVKPDEVNIKDKRMEEIIGK